MLFCHSFQGDKRMFTNLADIDAALLPHNIQVQIKVPPLINNYGITIYVLIQAMNLE